MAEEVNTNVDNIGARRLHTILERILEDVSFDAPEKVGRIGWGRRVRPVEGRHCCISLCAACQTVPLPGSCSLLLGRPRRAAARSTW